MKKFLSWSLIAGLALAGTLTLSACGGGGSSSDGASVSSTYTGTTVQATVTDANAESLAVSGYEGGSDTTSLMVLSAGAEPDHKPQLAQAASALESIARSLPIAPSVSPMALQPPVTGTCGGQFVIDINETQTSMSGSVVFTDYDDCSQVIDGTITFSGTADASNNVSVTMTFSTVTFSDPLGSSFSLSGSFSASFDATSEGGTMSMDVVFSDLDSDETYYYTYTITSVAGVDYEDISVSGRFYDYYAGYLQITTLDPVRSYNDSEPTSGKLLFEGADGTWLTYEITGSNTYTIEYYDGSTTGFIYGTN